MAKTGREVLPPFRDLLSKCRPGKRPSHSCYFLKSSLNSLEFPLAFLFGATCSLYQLSSAHQSIPFFITSYSPCASHLKHYSLRNTYLDSKHPRVGSRCLFKVHPDFQTSHCTTHLIEFHLNKHLPFVTYELSRQSGSMVYHLTQVTFVQGQVLKKTGL